MCHALQLGIILTHMGAEPSFRTDEGPAQLRLHLALTREHVFTQDKLLANARRIKGLA